METEAVGIHLVEEPKQRRPGSRKTIIRAVVILIVIAALAGTLIWYFLLRKPAAAPNYIDVSGRIETDDSAIAAKTTGRILQVNVREGDHVDAGAVIAILDGEQLKARQDQANSAVTQAETRVTRARQQIGILEDQLRQSDIGVQQSKEDAMGRVRQAESQVAQAEAQLAQAQSNLNLAEYDKEKFNRLLATGDISERQAKQAETNHNSQLEIVKAQKKQVDAARGALTASKATLANPKIRTSQSSAIQKQMAQAQSDIDAANADADKARGALREAQANQNDLSIVAPFAGTVATRAVEPGEFVAPGTVIITLIDPSAIYLRAFVPEGDIGKVKLGQAARVYIDSNPNQPLEATVSRIDPEAAFTPENTYFKEDRVKQVVGVKLQLKDPQGYAKPGMPADGQILTEGEWSSSGRKAK
ncbi:MAG: HlyD family efflux transporter periplasmic adaptor subunit [Acidobacteriota bacterium]